MNKNDSTVVSKYAGMLYRHYGVWHSGDHLADWIELVDGEMSAEEFRKYALEYIKNGDKMPTFNTIRRMRDRDIMKHACQARQPKPDRIEPHRARELIASAVAGISANIGKLDIPANKSSAESTETGQIVPPHKKDGGVATSALVSEKNYTTS
jgi:hypothetical protein